MDPKKLLRRKERALARELRPWLKDNNLIGPHQQILVTITIAYTENSPERLLAMDAREFLQEFWPKEFYCSNKVRLLNCFRSLYHWSEAAAKEVFSVQDALNMSPRDLLRRRNVGLKCYAAFVTICKRKGLKGNLLDQMELTGQEQRQLDQLTKHG